MFINILFIIYWYSLLNYWLKCGISSFRMKRGATPFSGSMVLTSLNKDTFFSRTRGDVGHMSTSSIGFHLPPRLCQWQTKRTPKPPINNLRTLLCVFVVISTVLALRCLLEFGCEQECIGASLFLLNLVFTCLKLIIYQCGY